MKIGILEADFVDEKPKEEFGSYADMFINLLSKVEVKIEYEVYKVIENNFPQKMDECDAYLITGSKFSAYDDLLWINNLKLFIKEAIKKKKKLVGICFGHQIIAEANEGVVRKSDKGWGVGLMEATVVNSKEWMEPSVKKYSLLLTHQDQVEKLPVGAELIASNEFCPNSSYGIGKHVLTFQGHPEFSPGYLMYLMNKRREIIGVDETIKAETSMSELADNQTIAKWIVEFIKFRY